MKRDGRASLIRTQVIMLVAACLLLAIGFGYHPTWDTNRENSVLAIDLAIYLFLSPVALVLHELGHVIAGKIAGVRMWAVIIGMGPGLLRFTVGGIVVELHAIPAYGFVRGSSYGMSAWRMRRIVWIAGGPMMNLFVAGAAIASQWTQINYHPLYNHVSVWLALAAVNSVMFLASMFGTTVRVSDSIIRSDGRQLYSLIFKRRQKSDAERKIEYITHRGMWLFSENREPDVIDLIRQPLADDPDHFLLRFFRAAAYLGIGEFESAEEIFADLLARHESADAARVVLLNTLVWTELCRERGGSSDEVQAWSDEAIHATPWDPSIRGTRGWPLIEKHDFEGGEKLLREALRDAESRQERALIFCTLALAAARQGNDEETELYLKKALGLDAGSTHLRHTRRTIDGLQQRSVVG